MHFSLIAAAGPMLPAGKAWAPCIGVTEIGFADAVSLVEAFTNTEQLRTACNN